MRITPRSVLDNGHRGTNRPTAARPRPTSMRPVEDKHVARLRSQVHRYVRSTSFVTGPGHSPHDPLLEGIRDAADECEHGHLPTDNTVLCGCWETAGSSVSTGGFSPLVGTMNT